MVELPVPEDPAPVEIDAAELMETPPGLVRRGDEFIDLANYKSCRRCRAETRRAASRCFNCGAELE